MPSQNTLALLEAVDPVVRGIVRAKLRASLRRDDGREHNLDAMDVVGDIRLKLVRRFQESDPQGVETIQTVSSYAATVSYHACADYLRSKYPRRARLKNCLRRVLEKSERTALWQTSQGDWVAGYAGWAGTLPPSGSSLDRVARPPGAFDLESPDGLIALATHAFDTAAEPVLLDDLVAWIARCAGIVDVQSVPLESRRPGGNEEQSVLDISPSSVPLAESHWLAAERMRLVWDAICQLLPWHRAAYLLNLRDAELDAFPYYGVASIDQIREALQLTAEQAARLAKSCGIDPAMHPRVQFAACWRFFPVDDNLIADVLQVSRPQVIAYRNKAIERLRRMLKGLSS